jgi:hypothetical protein
MAAQPKVPGAQVRKAPRGRSVTNEARGAAGSGGSLEAQLRLLLNGAWGSEEVPQELLGLGQPALERLLDAPDSAFWSTDMQWRDYGDRRQRAIAAFALGDMAAVLAAMKSRKWTAARTALSGIGLIRDPRVVPYLVDACEDPEPMTRSSVVSCLGAQRDPRATARVVLALRDRSSDVRLAAARALGDIGDPTTMDALHAVVERSGTALLAAEAREALRKIRRCLRRA